MTETLIQVVIFAVAVALSPFPVLAVIPMVTSHTGGRRRALVFLGAWALGLVLAMVVLVLISSLTYAGSSDSDDNARTVTSIVRLVAGTALVIVAVRKFHAHAHRGDQKVPAWVAMLGTASIQRVFGVGLLLSVANPKILIIAMGAATAVAEASLSPSTAAAMVAVFALVGSIGAAAPVVFAVGFGEWGARTMERLGAWLVRNEAIVIGVVLGLIGGKLSVDAVTQLLK